MLPRPYPGDSHQHRCLPNNPRIFHRTKIAAGAYRKLIDLIGAEGKVGIGIEDRKYNCSAEQLQGLTEVLDQTDINTVLVTTADLTQGACAGVLPDRQSRCQPLSTSMPIPSATALCFATWD